MSSSVSTAYEVEIPTHDYWQRQIECQFACPVHTDARGYVRAIAEGHDELAYLIARGPNPLASICGRVCGAPCESACRRGEIDSPIAIRALKRYVCEQFGPEARADGGKTLLAFLTEAATRYGQRDCEGPEELLPLLQSLTKGQIAPVRDRSVGIIGSGPAGLAAAHDLALLGFSVTIYEMEPVLGGMLAVGIPDYRLPRDLIQAEIEVILGLGVKVVTECCIGRDVSFPELRARHDAVVVAVGAKCSRTPPMPGSDAIGVLGGVEFLRDASLGKAPTLGQRVAIIGGGDVAMDSARTALRIEGEDAGAPWQPFLVLDAARTASRLGGREVHILYRRSLEEMPARQIEIIETEEEGVQFHLLTAPVSIEQNEQGQVRGMWCQHMQLGDPDASGRRRPVPIEGSEHFLECDNVVLAIGQTFDLSFIDPMRDGLELTDDGRIVCEPDTGRTAVPDVVVAGDLAYGPKLLIHAVASGKAVARTLYAQATARPITAEAVELHFPLHEYAREWGYEKQARLAPPMISVEERLLGGNLPGEIGFSTEQARREASRCLDCGVNTIFDGNRCILCAGCVDVCPELCLKLVPVSELQGDKSFDELVDLKQVKEQTEEMTAIIKDEALCIRCALCAARCPVDAITMERFMFKECPR